MKRGLWATNIFLGIVAALLLVTPITHAAKAPNGVQVTPLRTYPTQNPGTVTTGSLTITNYTSNPQQILLSTETFHTTGEDYRYAFGSSDAAKWVQFEEPTIQLAPKEAKVAKYSIVAPGDAAPGGKYLALITTIAPEAGSQKITEIRRIASLVYLQINGKVTRISSLLSLDTPRFTSKPSFISYVRVNNGGNTHHQARVAFYVNRWPLPGKGSYVTQLEGFILPGTVRQLNTIMHIPRSPGIYRVTAEYAPPQGAVNHISSVIFYIPMWFVISIVVFLVVLIILIIRFWRSRPTPKRKRIIHN